MSTLEDQISELTSEEKRALLEQLLAEEQAASPEGFPLSFSQQRLWFLDQLEPGTAAYNIPRALRLRGDLDLPALAGSFEEMVRRHESLRTVFRLIDEEPLQVVLPDLTLPMPQVDLRGLPAVQQEAEAALRIEAEAQQPFDLAHGPLARVTLLRIGSRESILLVTLHHIVSDGWSAGVFIQEMVALYQAFSRGLPSPLPDLPVQYVDYALSQREWLQGEELSERLREWRERLEGAPALLELPTDRPRPAVQSFRGAEERLALGPDSLVQRLTALSRERGGTLFMALLGAFTTLLYRYTGQTDLVVGSPVANRTQEETEGLIGFFVNTLVLRTDLSGHPTFLELLDRVREVTLAAYAGQDVPFERLVDELRPERTLGYAPLFQVLFAFQNTPTVPAVELSGLSLHPVEVPIRSSKFDLSLALSESGEGLWSVAEYSTDLFEAATVRRLLANFATLLQGVAAEPARPLLDLPLLSAAEHQQVAREWTGAGRPAVGYAPAHQLFEREAERSPDAVAVVAGNRSLTYAGLEGRANLLAHHLRSLGCGPEVRVGIAMGRSIEMIVAILGTWKAGSAYVPLDPEYPQERLALMATDARLAVLVTEERFLSRFPALDATCLTLEEEAFQGPDPGRLSAPWDDRLPAYVIYTSGSTGTPKGVVLSHRGLANLAGAQVRSLGVAPGDRILQFSSASFDASVWEIAMALFTGAELHLPEDRLLAGGELVRWLRDRRITIATLPPSVLAALPVEELPALRALVTAGEACPPELACRWLAPHRLVINAYGPTESTVCATMGEVDGDPGEAVRLSIGRPLSGISAYVLGPEQRLVPVGVAGELCLAGAGLARGYLGRPDLTAERFVPDPFDGSPGARLYRTGDLARWRPDGDLDFLGRADHQVKVRGFRIEPGEIEAALALHPGVREAAVLARERAEGTGKWLVAYMALAPGHELSAEKLREALRQRLPEHMVPGGWVFLPALPLSPNGKVDRRALAAHEPESRSTTRGLVAPRTPAEELLATIWAEMLRLERVGVHDNFFALGGDSILSIQITSRAQRAGLVITPRMLFQHQTVAELAAAAESAPGAGRAEQGPVTGPVPLIPIQRWFLDADPVDPHHFNQAVLLETVRPLDPAVLDAALVRLAIHHDALRLRFHQQPAGWTQVSASPEPGSSLLTIVDLSALPPAVRSGAVGAAAAQAQESLDIEQGPLYRPLLFDLGPEQNGRFFWAIHHLAVDGVSWRILLEDLATVYGSLPLPAKTTSFKRWAERLVEYAASPELLEQVRFWRERPWAELSPLPRDRSRDGNTNASESTVSFRLDPEETRALLQEVPAVYNTRINDALLCALAGAFRDWTGSPLLLVDLEGHGREEIDPGIDLSRTVGWFTSSYPVLLDLRESSDPGAALKAVKETLRRIPQGGIGYGLLHFAGELPGLPAAEVLFNYLGQLDQALPEGSRFRPAGEPTGAPRSPRARRSHALAWNGAVVDGRLGFSCAYSEDLHRRDTIEHLVRGVAGKLRELIEHCRRPEAGGFTPSDFPLANLDQKQLDNLLAAEGGDWRRIEDLYPLSPLQQGMLFHTLYAPDSGVYLAQMSCRLVGDLDRPLFRKAWENAVARHTTLRTSFAWEDLDRPLQVVHRTASLPIREEDWSDEPEGERQRKLTEHLAHDLASGFDLTRAPLLRLLLAREGSRQHRLIWTTHLLLLDGWSMPILVGEVFREYESLRRGGETQVETPTRYREYIAWLSRQESRPAESFFREELAGFTEPTRIPGERRGSAAGSGPTAARHQLLLSREATAELETLARESRLTLNTLVQGAWALLLARSTGERDVVFGATVSGRPPELPGVESMVGLFINTLPLRARIDAKAPLVAWLQALQARHAEARQFEHTPLFDIQGWSSVPRGTPLFDSLVVFENYPVDSSIRESGGSLVVDEVRFLEVTNYPVTLVVSPGQRLSLTALYDSSRLGLDDVHGLLTRLAALIEGMPESAGAPLWQLLGPAPAERRQILDWGGASTLSLPDACLHELFAAQVERSPEAVAAVEGEERWTYRELDRRARGLAVELARLGAGPEVRVGVCTGRSLDMVASLLAVLQAGGAYVPLDPSYPSERLRLILEDSGASVLVTERKHLDLLPRELPTLCLDETPAGGEAEALRGRASAGDLAYVIYTSGSTGRPKGVAIEHRSAVALVAWAREAFSPAELSGVLASTSIGFDLSVFEIFVPLSSGGTVVLAANALELPNLPAAGEVTLINTVPSAIAELARSRSIPSSVRTVNLAGEPLKAALAREVYRVSGAGRVLNLYGPTEDTTYSTWALVVPDGEEEPVIGRPISGGRAYVLGPEQRMVPVGVTGELCLGGAGLARGYLGRPDLTAERFIPDPFGGSPGARLYRTGDLARWRPDGDLDFLGRADHQVKVRGFRIEPGEIEAALALQPGVREAAVLARERPEGAGKWLVAYVAPAEGHEPSAEELRETLRQRLPEHMVPGGWVFLPALPLSPNGKVDRRALAAHEPESRSTTRGLVAPRTPAEELLATIWAEMLRLERVGVHDNFFALGGDSILSIQITSRAQRAGLAITPRMLFQYQTVAELAAAAGNAPEAGHAEQGPVTGPVPLTPIQRGFLDADPVDPHHFNQAVLLETGRPLDPAGLDAALARLAVHHDALRLRFHPGPAGWTQVSASPETGSSPLTVVDLSALPPAVRSGAVGAAAAQAQESLDLERGPLHRPLLFDLGPQQNGRFFWAIHHLVVDGVSWRILLEDLGLACESLPLPAKTTSFKRWAERLVEYTGSPELREQGRFWRERPWAELSPLPRDRSQDGNTNASERTVSFRLDPEETRALLQEVPAVYNTQINDALLCALAGAFHDWTGSPLLLVDLEGHGREEIDPDLDLSRTVGWLTTSYPVLLDLRGSADPGAALKAVKETLRRIPQGGIGYGLLHFAGELPGLPAAEVLFNYLGQLDQALPEGSLFRPAGEPTGTPRSPRARRSHALAWNGAVVDGRLGFSCAYSEDLHRRDTIERLVQGVAGKLRELIEHCRRPEAGGFTPSDFPLANLDQKQLDKLLAARNRGTR